MLPPETSTIQSRLPAVPRRRRRSAALRARSSCLETSGSRLVQDPDCTADDQTPPIENDPRALECDCRVRAGVVMKKQNFGTHCLTPPSLITSFPYNLQSCRWISIGLWFSTNKNLITECTSQLAWFSIAAHILKIHCEQSRSSTNRTLPQLDAYWERGRSDTKMAALATSIASPRQNVSYFLDNPRVYIYIYIYIYIYTYTYIMIAYFVYEDCWCYTKHISLHENNKV